MGAGAGYLTRDERFVLPPGVVEIFRTGYIRSSASLSLGLARIRLVDNPTLLKIFAAIDASGV